MNYNNTGVPQPTAPPKKNNTKTIAVVVIIGFITMFAAIGLYQETQKTLNNIVSAEPEATSISTPTTAASSDLEQKLFTKCENLQDWYKSLDGFESTNYHCDKYAKGWAGLVK